MELITSPADMRARVRAWRQEGRRIGLVPTMGNLHEGHLSLMRRAAADTDVAVASLFVNPLQFGAGEDFGNYPRTFEDDLAGAEQAGIAAMFAPSDGVMYPPGFATAVEVTGLTDRLCGAARPGHFRGVTTVVMKLFCLVQPDRAYFGEKDYQQMLVIERMATDLDTGIEIVPMPVVREPDGLAMSSRNRYLGPEDRTAATCLHRGL
ncbi:MAG: pantoate--beta-alanine ligase, partial [Armatimonadetes bacterium]|nr:pantoate--beta-alanine ligase [Armatimonadota bacterium]